MLTPNYIFLLFLSNNVWNNTLKTLKISIYKKIVFVSPRIPIVSLTYLGLVLYTV